MKRQLIAILIAAALIPVPYVMAKGPSLFKPSVIKVQRSSVVKAPAGWSLSNENIQKKLKEASTLLKKTSLAVGDTKITYEEKRVVSDGSDISVATQNFKDYEREIALVLLNEKTGKLDAIKVIKRGGQLISPPGYQIQVVERMNGIRWNYWATQYKVLSPKNSVVLLNKYPLEKTNGDIEYFTYSPYSDDLDNPTVIKEGALYLHDIVEGARADLRAKGVMSKAIPGKLVVDTLPASYFEHLPFLEQSDLLEALTNNPWTVKRILGTLGYNKGRAWTLTGNYAGAFGWVQFTDNSGRGRLGTYSTIVRMYPEAKLDPNFETGAADHQNSIEAAMLLYDTNLQLLINKFGGGILNNALLEEYLAASYNGPPSKVVSSLESVGVQGSQSNANWYQGLFAETEGYIAKLRLLQNSDVPSKFLD